MTFGTSTRLGKKETCPARGRRGTERARHVPFAPRAGRRWRQPDEGLVSAISSAEGLLDACRAMVYSLYHE
ncbi:hypothetical protein EFR84_21415 [Rhizobium chutanense]|uniref:Uncharacterized protein n=1 Tax=Rhizobium chutanense TaxID=2035448 RepID=A0A3S0SA47_9HYPH|nr:hypothetical protein EFR84_21415 [Rhizobium chutanense]